GGEDGAAAVSEIAAIPGEEDVVRQRRVEGAEKDCGVGGGSIELRAPGSAQPPDAQQPVVARGLGIRGQGFEGGAGVARDGRIERAIEAELLWVDIDLQKLR